MAHIDRDYFNTQMVTLGLKSTFTPNSDQLDVLLQEASDYVDDYCGRKFASATYTEQVNAFRDGRLMVQNFPVTALTSISWVDRTGMTGTDDVTGVNFYPEGILEFRNSVFAFRQDRLYTVTYTAGYTAIPGPVKRAVALKTANLLQPMYTGPMQQAVEMVGLNEDQILILLERYRVEHIW